MPKAIQLVRRQWSGSEHRVIEGIGIVTCVYVNPQTRAYWIIDYRAAEGSPPLKD